MRLDFFVKIEGQSLDLSYLTKVLSLLVEQRPQTTFLHGATSCVFYSSRIICSLLSTYADLSSAVVVCRHPPLWPFGIQWI